MNTLQTRTAIRFSDRAHVLQAGIVYLGAALGFVPAWGYRKRSGAGRGSI